jgi:8-oxo-dGTP diphosphatase
MTTDQPNRKPTVAGPSQAAQKMPTHWPPHWPKAAASIAVFRGNTVLLVERGKPPRAGLWSLPGGHIEPGEAAVAAALRELDEETGVAAAMVGLVDILDVITRDDTGQLTAHYLLAVFCGHWSSGEPVAASDSRAARFVPVDDLVAYPLTPGASGIITKAQQLISPYKSL